MSKIERKAIRTVFTKTANALQELIDTHEEVGLDAIVCKFSSVSDLHSKLLTLDEAILRQIVEDEETQEEDIENEVTKALEYTYKYNELNLKIQKLQKSEVESVANSESFSNQTKMRLPKIELKKFDGEIKNWIGFWSQFSKINDDENLKDEDKFEYLLQCMKPDSPAQKLIEGFPPSRENYQKAVDLLKSRFGKDEILIEYYVRELLTLVLKREENLSVTFLYDKLEVQLRALDSLGVTKDKYAAILFPLVESAIPEPIFKVWERHRVVKNASTKDPDSCLTQLLDFLKIEVEAEERLKLRSNKFDSKENVVKQDLRTTRPVKNKMHLPSATVLVSSSDPESSNKMCLFCSKNSHMSHDCFSLIDMTVDERVEAIKKKGACLRCMKIGHMANKCKGMVKCHICKGKHLSILCQKTQGTKTADNVKLPKDAPVQSTINSISTVESTTTYLQTLRAVIDSGSKSVEVRILCDSGSQKSFISEQCVNHLGLRPNGSILMQQELFGGSKTKSREHKTYNISLKSLNLDYKVNIDVLEQPVICTQVPQVCNQRLIKMLAEKNVALSDVSNTNKAICTEIDILLGADAWAKIITSKIQKINDQLVAIKTQLGWTVVGKSDGKSPIISTMFVNSLPQQDIKQFWDLETMGILPPTEKLTDEEKDKEVLQFFDDTVEREEDGRYLVKLPWIKDHPDLQSNRLQAEKRLRSTTRKLHKMNLYSGYDAVFRDWLDKGIIEKISSDETSQELKVHYLPHHAVVKEGSSTRIRPVFDASTKDSNGYCINECLEPGPNLIELIPVVLTNFRKYTYALTSDIEKAFLQISVDPADRDLLRFLWWENGEIIVYRHARVVFGLSCSPFILGAVLRSHLENVSSAELKPVAETLKKSFYVDNCLTGVNQLSEQETFINDAQILLKQGGFNLRGWAGNKFFTSDDHVENILGLRWFCSRDELCCNTSFLNLKPTDLTRRTLLSCAQKIFDPIGLTAPVALVPKLILQKTWAMKAGWDDELPEEMQKEYYKWAEQLDCLEMCSMSRKIYVNESSTLHVFCDASKDAFGCCIFLRTEVNGLVHVNLILAKARVAPIKPMSMPRLELMGAVTGVRLYLLALRCLDNPSIPALFWLDSSVALAWIAKQGKWSVFVENRVKEINSFTKPSQWRHVPGPANPADLLSRGCNSKQLLNSKWWNGPEWLYKSEHEWPSNTPLPDTREIEKETKRSVVTINTIESPPTIVETLGNRISKYSMIVRTIAWMFRLSPKNEIKPETDITSEEFKRAEKTLLRLIQEDSFHKDLKCKALSGINAFIDEDGIIRFKSRLLNNEDSLEYIYPIILPSSHPVVEKMIEQYHTENKHAGAQALLVILREKVWILKGRKTISKVIHKCTSCKRQTAAALEVPTPPLPTDRTNISACFQVSGVDLAGPLIERSGQKCWVVIFTCAVYRAVHLELIQSLSTEAFIQALRRFIARRGRVSIMYSDNGSNFTGFNRQLQVLDWNKIQNEFNLKSIVWKFNPPASPWWGGFWERLIRLLKELLRKSLGHASLSYEELNTLICECEGVMNGRPLTYVSEETNELKPLTPAMFLQSIHGNDVSDLDLLERTCLKTRWEYIQKVRDGLKSRFRKEYLGFLRSDKKNRFDKIQEGDVVLVHNEDRKRINWPLGLVVKVIPGRDNVVRLVQVKTRRGVLLKPVQRLYPLEIAKTEENFLKRRPENNKTINLEPETSKKENPTKRVDFKTRSGRQIKEVNRLDL